MLNKDLKMTNIWDALMLLSKSGHLSIRIDPKIGFFKAFSQIGCTSIQLTN